MADCLETLIETIKRMRDGYQRLVQLAKEQKQALISGDNAALKSVVEKLNIQTEKLNELESIRQQGMDIFGEIYAVPVDERNASAVLLHLSGRAHETFTRVVDEFRRATEELQSLNTQNAQLTLQSIGYTTRVLELLVSGSAGTTYGRTPYSNAQHPSRFISIQT